MAGLKTPSRKKRDATKPNTILVIFLVFFILVSIGLGVWGYYGYAGQEKLEATAKTDKKNLQAEKEVRDYQLFIASEARTAIGGPANPKDAVVDPDDAVFVGAIRKDFVEPNSKYKAGDKSYTKYYEPMLKMIKTFESDLGGYDETTKRYNTTYREVVAKLVDELKQYQAQLTSTQKNLEEANGKFAGQQANQEKYWTNAMSVINKGNKDALKASTDRTKAMEMQFELTKKQNDEIEQIKKDFGEKIDSLERKIKQLNMAAADKAEAGGPVANTTRPVGPDQVHALILDISRGKPLWDAPLGKITSMDVPERKVYINVGSATGLKPQTTFNIFGAAWNGRAEKDLKATIEVISVLGPQSSLARITSLYDIDGHEIVLADPRSGRSSREADNALKEGDLLFNTFFGAHVAIAGNIQFGGQVSDSPAEQMRILASFVQYLNRNGISVDAYLDLNDGQVKGAITNRTRYLIRGDDLIDPTQVGVVKKKQPAKDADADDAKAADAAKADAPKADVLPDRLKGINDAAARMRQEAIDRGLFIISTENFLNTIGYRQPRGASEVSGFSPSSISAGIVPENPRIQAVPPPAEDRPADDKAAEKKDM